jgi:hypothetical protein
MKDGNIERMLQRTGSGKDVSEDVLGVVNPEILVPYKNEVP